MRSRLCFGKKGRNMQENGLLAIVLYEDRDCIVELDLITGEMRERRRDYEQTH